MNPNVRRNWLHYGRGQLELSDDELSQAAGPDFEAELLRIFSAPGYQPPALPAVALKVMELSRRRSVEFEEVSALLEQDPMLVAKVMTRIQSAFYASQTPIRTLKQALVRLGIGGLRDLVMEVALNLRVFRAPAFAEPMNRLRRHSLVTAHCARIVCRYASVDAEYAFLCGLLHDVGIAATLVALGDGQVKSVPDQRTVDGRALLWAAIEESHQKVSGLVAGLWKLPEEIKLVLAHHHQLNIDGFPHPMIAALLVAHGHSAALGAALGGGEGMPPGLDVVEPQQLARAQAALRLGPFQVQCIERDVKALAAAIEKGL